jgi:hypothetical protein
MLKKTVAAVLVSSFVLAGSVSAGAALPVLKPALGIDVVVDGMKTTFPDTEPFTDVNNNTMVPIRFVSEKLGAKVLWDNNKQVVTLDYNGKNIVMPVGSNNVTVDGVAQTLNTSAIKVEGRVMVPLRFVSETLGTTVNWDQNAVMVNITSPSYQAKIDAGSVKLDAWGRELRASQTNSYWTTLTDTPDWVYAIKTPDLLDNGLSPMTSKEVENRYVKFTSDKVSKRIKEYYKYALNIDYKTFNASTYYKGISNSTQGAWSVSSMTRLSDWVKKNKVIVEGYAFPENQYYVKYNYFFERVKFKFRVISAVDSSQFNVDSWNATEDSTTPKFVKKGVWYYGYSDVMLDTKIYDMDDYYFKQAFETLKIKGSESMFRKGASQYKELR